MQVIKGEQITVVLNIYRRPQMLRRQLEALRAQTVGASHIIIWHNYSEGIEAEAELLQAPDVSYIRASTNFKYHGRFAAALLARTEYVAVFDDDVVPGCRWFENCFATMEKQEGILGGAGVFLLSPTYTPHVKFGWMNPNSQIVEVDLVGHAWFIKRDWLHHFWREEPLSWDTGEDIAFSYLAQKFGGLPTLVPPHPQHDIEMWSNTIGEAQGSDEVASWKVLPAHTAWRNGCVAKALKGGWRIRATASLAGRARSLTMRIKRSFKLNVRRALKSGWELLRPKS